MLGANKHKHSHTQQPNLQHVLGLAYTYAPTYSSLFIVHTERKIHIGVGGDK